MRPGPTVVALVLLGCGAASPRVGAGTPTLSLAHRSSMGSAFTLIGLRAALDGLPLASIGDPEGVLESPVALPTPICVLSTGVAPGSHSLRLELTYAGHGYGVFSYLRGYRFHAVDTLAVEVPADATHVAVRSIGHEGGGITTPMEERPATAWQVEVVRDGSAAGCSPSR